MSLCIGLPARAGRLVALISISCLFFRLLLICDVESALSMLAAAGSCCLQARRARRPCHVVQSFLDGWTARWAATSTLSGVVDGWGSSSDDWVARLPRGLIALL
jgi:hypothetical protein